MYKDFESCYVNWRKWKSYTFLRNKRKRYRAFDNDIFREVERERERERETGIYLYPVTDKIMAIKR